MLRTRPGAADAAGARSRLYRAGEIHDMSAAWQRALAGDFLEAGWAEPLAKPRKPARKAAGNRPKKAR